MEILVLPDIHGRDFWREPCKNIDKFDKVIFLGDYLDPYGFENISVETAIDNFKDILKFAKDNPKVVMLLGNHDMAYFSQTYYGFSSWHCRHSQTHHKDISALFKEHEDMFKIADVEDNILFTHAGCVSGWLNNTFGNDYFKEYNLPKLCDDINELLKTVYGLLQLYQVSRERGGDAFYGSCIWADYSEMRHDDNMHPIRGVKQIFGHTMQAYGKQKVVDNGSGHLKVICEYNFSENPLEYNNIKMLDNACAYELDTKEFKIQKIEDEKNQRKSLR